MPKGPKGEYRPADLNKRAFAIVQIATGEALEVLPKASQSKAGRAGASARVKVVSAKDRKAIAEKAAKARWSK